MRTVTARAWVALSGLSAVLLVVAAVVGAVIHEPLDAWPVLLVAWPVVGGLVVARRPEHLIAKLLVLFGAIFAVMAAGEVYVGLGLSGRDLPAVDLAGWVLAWIGVVAMVALIWLVVSFPSGVVIAPWRRRLLAAAVGLACLTVGGRMILPVQSTTAHGGLTNPRFAVDDPTLLAAVGVLDWAGIGILLVALVDLVVRWRRSAGVERLQMRWLALALTLFAASLVGTSALRLLGLPEAVFEVTDMVAWVSGLAILPLAIGVAVSRYRLYEIDRLLSRTVTYGVVVGVLLAVYVGGVLLLRGLLPVEGPLPVAVSTLVVAALFNPLRRGVQVRVDRRFNRSRHDAQQELERFAARVRDRLDLDDLTGNLVAVVAATMQPATTSIWIPAGRGTSGRVPRLEGAHTHGDLRRTVPER